MSLLMSFLLFSGEGLCVILALCLPLISFLSQLVPCSFCNLTNFQVLSYLVSLPQPWTMCRTRLGQPTKEKLLKGSLLNYSSYMPQPSQSMLQYDLPQWANLLLTCTVVMHSWICCSLVMPRMHRMHLLWKLKPLVSDWSLLCNISTSNLSTRLA